MGKPQFRFWKYFACNVLTLYGVSGRKFVKGVTCTLSQTQNGSFVPMETMTF